MIIISLIQLRLTMNILQVSSIVENLVQSNLYFSLWLNRICLKTDWIKMWYFEVYFYTRSSATDCSDWKLLLTVLEYPTIDDITQQWSKTCTVMAWKICRVLIYFNRGIDSYSKQPLFEYWFYIRKKLLIIIYPPSIPISRLAPIRVPTIFQVSMVLILWNWTLLREIW